MLIIGVTAAILIAVVLLETADLWWGYDRSVSVAEKRATNLTSVLAEYMRGSFAVADTSLRQLAVHASRVGGAAAEAFEWDPILAAARAAMSVGASGSAERWPSMFFSRTTPNSPPGDGTITFGLMPWA